MKRNKKIVVLYHGGCKDGFGAAWAAWKKFGARAEYIGVNQGEPFPNNLKGKRVYTLDFSYPFDITKKLLKIAKSLVVIDHHISSKKAIQLVPEHVFNNDFTHSGAALSWKYFHPEKKVPELLKRIEEVDIWKWNLPNTRELFASLETYDTNFILWNKIANDWESAHKRQKYLKEGEAILKYQDYLIKKAIENSEEVRFLGQRALAANFALSLNSEIGDAMRKKGYSLGIIWQKKGNEIVVSLRSTNKVDSSKIAARFGGGGHKKAAAFRLPINQKFPWKRIKK